MREEHTSPDGDLQNEIARIERLVSGMYSQLEDFTRQYGSQILLLRPLRVEAASELACIIGDCRSVSEALSKLVTEQQIRPISAPHS